MAQLIEAQGNAFLAKCKGIAAIISVVTALVLGVLNWFKDAKDPRVKVGYQELSKQLEGLSGDIQKLAATARTQGEEISTIQNWIINEKDRRGAEPGPAAKKILKSVKTAKPPAMPAPPSRKPATWDQVQQQAQVPVKGS